MRKTIVVSDEILNKLKDLEISFWPVSADTMNQKIDYLIQFYNKYKEDHKSEFTI